MTAGEVAPIDGELHGAIIFDAEAEEQRGGFERNGFRHARLEHDGHTIVAIFDGELVAVGHSRVRCAHRQNSRTVSAPFATLEIPFHAPPRLPLVVSTLNVAP